MCMDYTTDLSIMEFISIWSHSKSAYFSGFLMIVVVGNGMFSLEWIP